MKHYSSISCILIGQIVVDVYHIRGDPCVGYRYFHCTALHRNGCLTVVWQFTKGQI